MVKFTYIGLCTYKLFSLLCDCVLLVQCFIFINVVVEVK